MKVTIRTTGEDERERCHVLVDGETLVNIGSSLSECPEDATLSRDLNFVLFLPETLQKAHAAGAAGEPFELEEVGDAA